VTSGLGALLPNEGMTAQMDCTEGTGPDARDTARVLSVVDETRHLRRRHPGLLPGTRLGTGTGAGRGPGWSGGGRSEKDRLPVGLPFFGGRWDLTQPVS
jgi:hypothetical protein